MEQHVQQKLQRQKALFDSRGGEKTQVLFQFLLEPDEHTPVKPELRPENKQQRIDWAKRRYEYEMEISRQLDDDTVPCLEVASSTAIFAEPFGAKMFYPPDSNPCGMHFIEEPEEAEALVVPKLEDSGLMYYFDIADELYRCGGKDAVLRIPDLQDPMGVMGIMWDKACMLCAMLEEPEVVHELSDKIYTLETAFLDQWFRRYGKRFAAHYPNYVLEEGVSMSVDEVGIVSPALFREFFLQHLNDLSRRYGGIGIHCCADSQHQFENFARVENLKLMNLYRPNPYRKQAYEIFKDVCVQCHGDFIDAIPTYIGPEAPGMVPEGARVIYREVVPNLDEARRRCEQYQKRFR